MSEFFRRIGDLYQRDIIATDKEAQFCILVAFLLTFLVVRGITHAIRSGRGKKIFRNMSSGGTHIHHLVWGILLLLLTGYLALAFNPDRFRNELAVLFGIGAALTLDEFALWLTLKDVYWAKQGRDSVDAVITAATVVGIFLLGRSFWVDAVREVGRLIGIG